MFQQVGCKTMAQGMGTYALADIDFFSIDMDNLVYAGRTVLFSVRSFKEPVARFV